jgi:hypothetical protein
MYSLDGGYNNTFNILPGSDPTGMVYIPVFGPLTRRTLLGLVQVNNNLFAVSGLTPGEHSITITFAGPSTSSAAPLIIDYFDVRTNPLGACTPFSRSDSTLIPAWDFCESQPDIPFDLKSTVQMNAGEIAGGVVGSIASAIVMGLTMRYWLRRKSRRQ